MAHRSRARRAPRTVKRTDRARAGFRRALGRDPGQVGHVSVPIQKLGPLPSEALPHFWHPERPGVEHCPKDFAVKLAAVHPDLRLTRAPSRAPVPVPGAWLLWVRKESIRHRLCPGWQLLMDWQVGKRPLPLDDRLFAAIAHFDRRHLGENAVQYFDRIMRERDRERTAKDTKHRADVVYEAKDFLQSTKIKNIGRGNKFALHHDGTVLPSRGERNWTRERERLILPGRVKLDMERRRS